MVVVIGTGSKTEFGKIAKSLEDSEEETTPLQKKLDEFGELLGYAQVLRQTAVRTYGQWRKADWLMKTTFNGRAIRCTKPPRHSCAPKVRS